MLTGLIIPQAACLHDILQTEPARRLVDQGAALYLMADGTTNLLALHRPPGAFAKACGVRDLDAQPCVQ